MSKQCCDTDEKDLSNKKLPVPPAEFIKEEAHSHDHYDEDDDGHDHHGKEKQPGGSLTGICCWLS